MKSFSNFSICLLFVLFFISCQNDTPITDIEQDITANEDTNTPDDETGGDSDNSGNNDDDDTNDDTQGGTSDLTGLRTYIFGHSLLWHISSLNPTPSDENAVPHWMSSLSAHEGLDYAVSGQWGFLLQHDNLPPTPQWGFDQVESAWDDGSGVEFADADFNSILLTAGNFIQYQPPSENYYNENISPVDATLSIFDWTSTEEPGIKLYIYENWPDMGGFGFPPSQQQFNDYNELTRTSFHDWWIDYQNTLVAERPDLAIKMIPVGPIIAGLLTETTLSEIEITQLYEDDAPHGRPTTYFLASLITHMAMYGTQVDVNYEIPSIIHPMVSDNFQMIIDYIWAELQDFNFEDGSSRVFDETN